ncbi:hypothetical protein EVAR_5839_1 [Eumeta japonica]|uniref:Uncharacterized protein n=1 Tax=Eumeta variegata TaxID=151549 RepID=A0A4C1TBZ5_EUMVA|nr:hypothetical protein EVAR_5839_1 [Eumeta japonica]
MARREPLEFSFVRPSIRPYVTGAEPRSPAGKSVNSEEKLRILSTERRSCETPRSSAGVTSSSAEGAGAERKVGSLRLRFAPLRNSGSSETIADSPQPAELRMRSVTDGRERGVEQALSVDVGHVIWTPARAAPPGGARRV